MSDRYASYLPKSSGLRFSNQRSMSSLLFLRMTLSFTNTGAFDRKASAIASLGRASIEYSESSYERCTLA